PQALYERAERIYWEKLIEPYRPLRDIPDRDEVLFRQSTFYSDQDMFQPLRPLSGAICLSFEFFTITTSPMSEEL
ncbi:hypothetical protein ACFU76_30820, partial [Streptomyces sp. NPDC057539]|uniref:hypothetical protein n=1 Tax=Streptomyces sp. NPDC057539 TaxID=3346159 RepID=UPI003686598C